MNKLFFILFVILILTSCTADDDPVVPDNGSERMNYVDKDSLSLIDENGVSYSPFLSNDSTIHFLLPNETDFNNLEVKSFYDGDSVMINDHLIKSGKVDLSDYTTPAVYIKQLSDNIILRKKIVIYDIPVLTIDTPDSQPIKSKTDRVKGCTVKVLEANGVVTDLGTAGIRGRGKSTWIMSPKKPYNVKLDKKNSILGMPKSKNWILLANAYYDRTQIHNSTAFEIARLTDYEWVQQGKFVELILNNEHRGIYYLCEKIGAEKEKIQITEAKDNTSPEDIGYLLESYVVLESDFNIDTYPDNCFNTGVLTKTGYGVNRCVLGWEIKEPEDYLTSAHKDYINDQLQHLENLIKNDVTSGLYRDYFDIESAIDWWLTETASINEEATRTKNVYMYKDKGGIFRLGPPWDFDYSTFGQLKVGAQTWSLNSALYFKYLFQDPFFVSRVKEKWNEYKYVWKDKIPAFIDEQYNLLRRTGERNSKMWPDWWWPNYYPQYSYEELVMKMKQDFLLQLEYMDQFINEM